MTISLIHIAWDEETIGDAMRLWSKVLVPEAYCDGILKQG